MATIERRGVVTASPEDVWSVLADFGAISAWAPNVDHSCLLTDQEPGVGMSRRNQIGRATVVETVTEWHPSATLAYTITGLPKVLRSAANTWRLTSSGNRTVMTLTTEIDAGPRPPQQAIAKVVARQFAKASDQMIGGLIAFLNGRASATTSSGESASTLPRPKLTAADGGGS